MAAAPPPSLLGSRDGRLGAASMLLLVFQGTALSLTLGYSRCVMMVARGCGMNGRVRSAAIGAPAGRRAPTTAPLSALSSRAAPPYLTSVAVAWTETIKLALCAAMAAASALKEAPSTATCTSRTPK